LGGIVNNIARVIEIILLGGLMGLFGQGIRAIVGLKSMVDQANEKGVSQNELFDAARLLISLVIGFLAGIAATLALGFDKFETIQMSLLLGIAAAGYSGTDFIEGFISQYLPGGKPAARPDRKDRDANGGDGQPPEAQQKGAQAKPDALQQQAPETTASIQAVQKQLSQVTSATSDSSLPALHGKVDTMMRQLDSLHEAAATPEPAEDAAPPTEAAGITDKVTPTIVKKMFPATPLSNIAKNLPFVLEGLVWKDLTDKAMVDMALSTIRAETEGFVPIPEGKSRFNTSVTPFDKYEPGTELGRNLGNTQPGDGPRFKGRGYVQLTGRSNYTHIGPKVGVDLLANPDKACDPGIAGKILAQYLSDHEETIRAALATGDLVRARKAVNGGTNGFANFKSAYEIGVDVLPVA
jgi:putative chitinase